MKPYDLLISSKRMKDTRVSSRSLDGEADSDRGRVLFSAAFRRLQNKAQVFLLESNAAVRSRLTHSLEVSSVGRYIAQEVLHKFGERRAELGLTGKEHAFATFVETACLLHDIGNPPFGHFGERAIGTWFTDTDRKPSSFPQRSRTHAHLAEFGRFDGNPQGFRIVTRLQPERSGDEFGANLLTFHRENRSKGGSTRRSGRDLLPACGRQGARWRSNGDDDSGWRCTAAA